MRAPDSEWRHLGPGVGGVKNTRKSPACRGLVGLFAGKGPANVRPDSGNPIASMRALFLVIDLILQLYIWLIVAAAVLSWLVAFNVVNTRNQFVAMIGDFLYRITEPVLRPIRNMLPNLGGLDISPVIVIFIIIFLRYVIALYILPNVF